MNFRIARPETAFRKTAKPVKDRNYLAWIHQLPCVITGLTPVEAAHLSTANHLRGQTGRGKGTKASDRWCLPLHADQHVSQHRMSELAFYRSHGIHDPWLLALVLYGCFLDDNLDGAIYICKEARRLDI